MRKIIFVEGPDGVGKTTLCNSIIDSLGGQYIHLFKKDDMEEVFEDLLNTIETSSTDENLIIDRACLSNIAYSEVFKDAVTVNRDLHSKILSYADLLIMCLPGDKKEYLNAFNDLSNEREELYDNMNDIYDKFQEMYKTIDEFVPKDRCILYDYQKVDIEDVSTFVKENII